VNSWEEERIMGIKDRPAWLHSASQEELCISIWKGLYQVRSAQEEDATVRERADRCKGSGHLHLSIALVGRRELRTGTGQLSQREETELKELLTLRLDLQKSPISDPTSLILHTSEETEAC